MDDLIWQDVCEVLQHPQSIEHALRRALAGNLLPQELQARRQQVRKARSALSSQGERLTEAYLAGVLPLAEYQRRRHDLARRRHAPDRQAAQIEATVQQQMELAAFSRSITDFCQRVRFCPKSPFLHAIQEL